MKRLRRVQLPGGKIVDFHEEHVDPLHLCACGCDMVYPLDDTIEEFDEHSWQFTTCCPNCNLLSNVVAEDYECDMYNDHLDQGDMALHRAYHTTMMTNMAEEVERFAVALKLGAVLPEDFGHPRL